VSVTSSARAASSGYQSRRSGFGVRSTLRWRELDSNLRFRARADSILPVRFVADSLLEGTGFEPSVPPRKTAVERGPRPTIVVSRDDLCLMTPSSSSVRHLPSAAAERPFARAGPMVRIRFPPAASLVRTGLLFAHPAYAKASRCRPGKWTKPSRCGRGSDDPPAAKMKHEH
jgi:hypothetical protein